MPDEVWCFVEQVQGRAATVSWELLGEGAKLARDLGVKLAAAVLGNHCEHLAREAISYGADRVYLVDSPVLKDYRNTPYLLTLSRLIRDHCPNVVLMGATTLGRDLSGAVATELETGLTADCTNLEIDPATKLLKQTRPAFGGNIMATILCQERRPQMATVRPRVMAMPERDEKRSGEIIRESCPVREEEVPERMIELIEEAGSAVYLDKAEIIVSGGRGIGEARHFEMLRKLANVLGGSLGASRAAVEAGWISPAHQIGQTGQTVRPKIYFAVGISGAIQHLVGMQTSDVIVAVNKDRDAPIFRVATYGIVGDFAEVVPALIEEFRKRLSRPGARPPAPDTDGRSAGFPEVPPQAHNPPAPAAIDNPPPGGAD